MRNTETTTTLSHPFIQMEWNKGKTHQQNERKNVTTRNAQKLPRQNYKYPVLKLECGISSVSDPLPPTARDPIDQHRLRDSE